MIRKRIVVLVAGLLNFGIAVTSQGALFSGTYTFDTANNDVPASDGNVSFGSFSSAGVTEDAWTSGRYGAGGKPPAGWTTTYSSSLYVGFMLTPEAGYSATLTGFSFDIPYVKGMANGAGAAKWEIWQDGAMQISTAFALPSQSGTFSFTPTFTFNSPISIRFFGLKSNSGNDVSDLTFDNVVLGGSSGITPVPEPIHYALAIFGVIFVGTRAGRWYHRRDKRA